MQACPCVLWCVFPDRKKVAHMETLYTPTEVADILKVSYRSLERWRKKQQGPAWIVVGGQIRYPHSDVQAYIEKAKENR